MKKLPTSIPVGGKRVKVVIATEMEGFGQYDHDKHEIRISSRALSKASILRETLRHELMHAAMAISGISFMEKFEEEAVVRCFDEIFFPCWDRLREKYNL